MKSKKQLVTALLKNTLIRICKRHNLDIENGFLRKEIENSLIKHRRITTYKILNELRADEILRLVNYFKIKTEKDNIREKVFEYFNEAHKYPTFEEIKSIKDISSAQRKLYLRSLAWVALQDEKICKKEETFLKQAATNLGIKPLTTLTEINHKQKLSKAVGIIEDPILRAILISQLFTVAFVDSDYDARERAGIIRVGYELGLFPYEILNIEKSIIQGIRDEIDKEKLVKKKKGKWDLKRFAIVAAGATAVALTGGAAAPAIGGALGSALFGLSGAAATSAGLAALGGGALAAGGFGMAGGTAVISGLFGVAGAKSLSKYTKGVEEFKIEILQERKCTPRTLLGISGFLSQKADFVKDWKSLLELDDEATTLSVRWESKTLLKLGEALGETSAKVYAKYGITYFAKQATRKAGTLMNFPTTMLGLLDLINNPWNRARKNAEESGKILGELIRERPFGKRPITLVGFSLGARMIAYALRELTNHEIQQNISGVVFLGGAVDSTLNDWRRVVKNVPGPVVNGYCKTDFVLNYLYKAAQLKSPIGIDSLNVSSVINVDLTKIVKGHMDYRPKLKKVLKKITDELTLEGMCL